MKKRNELVIDNRRPEDDSYPNFEPAEMSANLLQVDVNQYVVDRNGDIRIVTTSNKKYFPIESFVDSSNAGYFRAKYIGNEDDSLEYANQCRLATEDEIAKAKSWTKSEFSYRINTEGQLLLI